MLARAILLAESYPLYYVPDIRTPKMFLSAKIFSKKKKPLKFLRFKGIGSVDILYIFHYPKCFLFFFDLLEPLANGAMRFESELLGNLLLRITIRFQLEDLDIGLVTEKDIEFFNRFHHFKMLLRIFI